MTSDATRGLHGYLVDRLGRMIASGELAAGARIVPEELTERFGASRPVVREALRALEAKGMVRPRPKVGTRVLPMRQWNLLDRDVIRWRVAGPDGSRQLDELSDLRTAVEVHAARRCAAYATAQQVAELQQACDAMAAAAAARDHTAFTTADVAFHTTLLAASGNAMFRHFTEPFAAFLTAREDLRTLPDQVDPAVVDSHRRLVAAIESQDGDGAAAIAHALIEAARAEVAAARQP
ncbi:FadR/GntR family transcriptional regulator [Hamadaea sp. NPDC050747]|uniref:FadR/GntR family transcriptional regulator n=1 Tax=Hamadaea sp. NPDC050747 TaxID=3155789 RepID=UPI0033DA1868